VVSVRVEFRWSEEFAARVDAARKTDAGDVSRASWVRRVVERALGEFGEADAAAVPSVNRASPEPMTSAPSESVDAERALSEAQGPLIATQADSGPVSSSEDVRSAAPAEQPEPADVHRAVWDRIAAERQAAGAPLEPAIPQPYRRQPGPDVRNIRSSQQARRNARPIPKGKR
jgi:hypothetical protein